MSSGASRRTQLNSSLNMPRCRFCQSQFATISLCSHCGSKNPCPLLKISAGVGIIVSLLLAVYFFFLFRDLWNGWRNAEDQATHYVAPFNPNQTKPNQKYP